MTPDETATVLAKCAAYDQRTVGRSDVAAWHEVLGDIEYADALYAVGAHYRQTTDRAMPANIRQHAKVARDERHRFARRAEPLALASAFEDDPDRNARIARGVTVARAALPAEPETDRIHRTALNRARAEHGKPLRTEKRRSKRKPKEIGPVSDEVATMAVRYLRDGYEPADVAERFGIARRWCERMARRIGDRTTDGWCGQCTYAGRMRSDGQTTWPCPECAGEV